MTSLAIAIALMAPGQGPTPEPEHAANPIFRAVLGEGLAADGVTVRLPEPRLRDGMSEDDRRSSLKEAVDLPLDEFLRDSVNAPFKFKARDVPFPGGLVRVVDLWFAVHADLDEIDMDDVAGQSRKGGSGEAGNMSMEVRVLTDAELKAHAKAPSAPLDRYILSSGLLLDRIRVVTTSHIVATRSRESIVVASMTATDLGDDKELANRWWPVPRPGKPDESASPRPYPGIASYTRISRFAKEPAILLVEAHVAFAEPKAWFEGAPILRSKISLVAQDQVRQLRRDVAKRRKEAKRPASTAGSRVPQP